MYSKLEGKIKSYLERKIEETDSETITAYNLIILLKNELNEYLKLLRTETKTLEINKKNKKRHLLSMKSFIQISNIQCYSKTDDNYAEVLIYFDKKVNGMPLIGKIIKLDGREELELECSKEYYLEFIKIVRNNIDYFINLLTTIEKYKKQYGISCAGQSVSQDSHYEYSDGNIDIVINLNGEVSHQIRFSDITEREYSKETWLSRKSIDKLIEENDEEILKRVNIPLNKLNKTHKRIVNSCNVKSLKLVRKMN